MSYLRGDWYAWSDGERVHVWCRKADEDDTEYARACDFAGGVAIPDDVFDALVLMRAAEIASDGALHDAERRALERGAGNVGSHALYAKLKITLPWDDD